MSLFQIKHRITGNVLFERDCDSMRICVEAAVESRADLRDADLRFSDLRGANMRDATLRFSDLRGANLRGADLAGANLAGATGIKGVLSVGPIGSRRDYLLALDTDAGLVIRAGCFSGSLAEFEAAVTATHGDNEHAIHYRAAIALIRARFPGQAKAEAA